MFCIITKIIKLSVRTYENSFRERIPLEDEGLTRWDPIDPEGVVEICESCSDAVYPMDWIKKEVKHEETEEIPLFLTEPYCIRCLGSLRTIIEKVKCTICKLENKNSN